METIFFKNWEGVMRVAIASFIAYLTLFLFIRISGKRTLTKLNAFDFVVAVTLGSTLSSMMLAKSPLVEGAAALIIIIAIQYVLALAAKKSHTMEKIINPPPSLLYYDGEFIEETINRQVITKEEVYARIRESNIEYMDDVKAVILEVNGEVSVVKSTMGTPPSTLEDIQFPRNKNL